MCLMSYIFLGTCELLQLRTKRNCGGRSNCNKYIYNSRWLQRWTLGHMGYLIMWMEDVA